MDFPFKLIYMSIILLLLAMLSCAVHWYEKQLDCVGYVPAYIKINSTDYSRRQLSERRIWLYAQAYLCCWDEEQV